MLAKVRFKDYRFLSVNPRSVLARPEYWQFSFSRKVPDFPRPKTIHTGQQSGSFLFLFLLGKRKVKDGGGS